MAITSIIRLGIFVLIVTFGSSGALADRVHLKDGSRIEGHIQQLQNDILVIETAFAGALEIPLSALAGLETDADVIIALTSGDRLRGQISFHRQDGQVLQSNLLGDVPITLSDMTGLWLPGESPDIRAIEQIEEKTRRTIAEIEEQHEQEVEQLETALVTPEKAWSGRTQLGISGARGNTDRISVNGKAVADRETEFDRLNLSLGWRFAREDGNETENEIIGETRIERDFSKHLFAFGTLSLEQDDFEDLDLRTILTAGTGIFFIQEEKQQLKARFGFGYQVEAFKSSPNEEEAILTLGYDYKIQLNGRLLFTHNLTYLPSISDPVNDFRIQSEAALDIPVTESAAWSVRLGVRNQYDNQPVAGNEKLDTFYSLSLGYNFD